MSARARVLEASVDLLWSQWTVLGVPGVGDLPAATVVSPVDLVLYTPGILGSRDPRLAMLVQAWCSQHGVATFSSRELVSRAASLPEPARDALVAFESWTAVLHDATGKPWPAPTRKSVPTGPAPDARRLAYRSDRRRAVHLRARGLFGVGVRADVVCALLQAHAERRPLRSPDLGHLGHTPRAVQHTLSAFESSGLVSADRSARTHTYALRHGAALETLLDAEGLVWMAWHHVFPIVFHLVALAAHPSSDEGVQRVRAHTIARLLAPHVHAVHGLPEIPVRAGQPDAEERVLDWGESTIRRFVG